MVNPFRGVRRNDPCPCGSGKKFKKCCLNAEAVNQPSSALPLLDPELEEGDGSALERADEAIWEEDEAIWEYDPFTEPDPQQWLAMDEQERIDLVVDYHLDAGIDFPRQELHAIAHVVVENQIADRKLPVRRIAQRLMSEGLDRHEAIHAIGSVFMGRFYDIAREIKSGRHGADTKSGRDPNEAYFAELEGLTADGWRRSG